MQDLISRQSAIKAIHEEFDECLVWDESGQHTADEVESILTSLPSADAVEARHGKWIKTRMPVTGAIEIKCSECDQKYYTAFPLVWGYCPNCGARMDGEQDG